MHEHQQELLPAGGFVQIIQGASRQPRPGGLELRSEHLFASEVPGYSVVVAREGSLAIKFFDAKGMQLDNDELNRTRPWWSAPRRLASMLTARACLRRSLMLAALVMLATGFAEPGEVVPNVPTVDWHAPDECPTAAELVARFKQLLQGTVASLPAATRAVIRREQSGYRLTLQWHGPLGAEQRELRATTCELLVKVAATTLAVQAAENKMSPASVESYSSEPPPPSSVPLPGARSPGSSRSPKVRPSSSNQVPGDEGRPPQVDLNPPARPIRRSAAVSPRRSGPHGPWVAVLGGALALPRVSAGVGVGYSWRPKLSELDIGIRLWPSREAALPAEITGQARVGMFSMPVAGCVRLGRGQLEFPLCAVVVGGVLWARGDSDVPNVKQAPEFEVWFAAGARGSLRWMFHPRLSLRTSVSLLGSMRRPSFAVVEAPHSPFHRPEAVALRFGLALELHARPRSAR